MTDKLKKAWAEKWRGLAVEGVDVDEVYADDFPEWIAAAIDMYPSYEGGCPSRFCKPEGYGNYKDEVLDPVNPHTRFSSDGTPQDLPELECSSAVSKLIDDIQERKAKYGNQEPLGEKYSYLPFHIII